MILKPRLFAKPIKGHWATDGLVGLWLMNESSGNTVQDLSGNNNTLTNNDAEWVSGESGVALKFVSGSSYLEKTPFTIEYPFTLVCRAYVTNVTASHTLISVAEASVATQWHAIMMGGAAAGDPIVAYTYDGVGASYASTTAYLANTYYTVAGIFSSASKREIYVFGGMTDYGINTTTRDVSGINKIKLGVTADSTPASYLDGCISWASIYNRALSASEIAQLYREPFCMFDYDPIELWSAATQGAGGVTENLAGVIGASASLSGALTKKASLGGTIAGSASLAGILNVHKRLSGTIEAVSALTGILEIQGKTPLAGQVNASAALTGALTVKRSLAGTINAISQLDGSLGIIGTEDLAGVIQAVSTLVGSLSVIKAKGMISPEIEQAPRLMTNNLAQSWLELCKYIEKHLRYHKKDIETLWQEKQRAS